LGHDAERRRPESHDRLARGLLQGVAAQAQVFAERRGRVTVYAAMVPAVTTDLVPRLGDVADQLRVRAGDLTNDVEGRLHLEAGQLVEQPARRGLQALAVMRLQRRVDL